MKFSEIKMDESKKRRMEITIETHSITIIRTRSGKPTNSTYCPSCETNVASFRHAHAALIFHVAFAELERLSPSRQIHFAKTDELCGNSLAAFFSRDIRYIED